MERYGYLIMIISLPIIWQIIVWTSGLEPFILPGPVLVVRHLFDDWPVFLYNTGVTMLGAMIGYAFANVFAVAVAILFVYIPSVQSILMPWFIVIKNIPYVVIAPILILTLGSTPLPKIIVVFIVTFFPLVANIAAGLRAADDVLLDRMRVLNASRWQIFWKVRWPAAIPYYMAAHEIAFTGAIIAAIVAEFFFSRQGLGFLIVTAMETYRADTLYGVTLVAGILGVGNYLLVVRLRKWVMRWQEA
ncbi:ABC transporter permease [uncultured Ruegeria sp.]|uniref:ABC transporter permease n=1 Tax=uncultured Ruegeria sp. TaxID=259304 RepID=UPI0026245B34|nr:ABC transporter permease [uncultured Ruegeria sp.]